MAKNTQNMTPRQILEQKQRAGRSNLLLAIVLTIVNIVMLLGGSDSMLLFSISVPYYAVIFGVIFETQELFITGCVIAAVVLVVYLLCWIMSKKHIGWLVAALVLMCIDTLALIAFYLLAGEISGVVDFVFHALIIYYLGSGISSAKKLQAMPAEPATVEEEQKPICNPEF